MISLPVRLRRMTTEIGGASLVGLAAYQAISGHLQNALALGISSTAVYLAPTLTKNSNWFGPVLNRFSTEHRELWLTIDDGPDPNQTPYTLDTLAKHQTHATFFVIGKQVLNFPKLCQRIAEEGHQVENHTFSHPAKSLWISRYKRIEREITDCSLVIGETVGVRPTLFRTPVGMANISVHLAAAKQHLSLIGWSATGHDGIPHQSSSVLRKILTTVSPGGIILLHDSHLTGSAPGSRAETLDQLLRRLKDLGYTFTLPSLARL